MRPSLQNHEIPTRPWQIIRTDLFHLDGKDYLLVSDYYSKFPFVRRLPINMTSSTVVGILKELFSEQGIPERVMSDNGPQFVLVYPRLLLQPHPTPVIDHDWKRSWSHLSEVSGDDPDSKLHITIFVCVVFRVSSSNWPYYTTVQYL